MLSKIITALRLSSPAKLRLKWRFCPICEAAKPIIRLNDNEIGIRCTACRSSVVSMSMASVIRSEYANLQNINAYELSARGPLVEYLKRQCKNLTTSEYYADKNRGEVHNDVLCQDVQNLTFDSNSFDLSTSTDVFEHVPDDSLGLKNIYRILKPAGKAIFTVPFWGYETVQRATLGKNGKLEYLLPPEYHGDPISTSGRILAFRNYGSDILNLLEDVDFKCPKLVSPDLPDFWGIKRQVIVAQK